MDGHQYEQKCAQYLREQGYTNVTVTRGSGDQGVDITAMKDGKKYAIQCKYYEGNVGNKAIQEVYAGAAFYNCSVAMVITNSFFTKSAKELAKKLKVILVEDINAIKLMESSRTAKPVEKPAPVFKAPSNEERYQNMVKRFPGNPKVDAEIAQYVQRKQSRIDSIIRQYQQEKSNVSSRTGILFGNSANAYMGSNDPQKAIEQNFMKSLQSEINEIDAYGRKCLKEGISEESAKKLIDLIVGTARLHRQCDSHFYACDLPQYDYRWGSLRQALPSELDGPGAVPIRKEIDCQKELIRLQREQIAELKQKIDRRESTLSAMQKSLNQQKAEAGSCRKKIEHNQTSQKKELSPLNQQLKIIDDQIQQANEKKALLEQERKNLPLLAFKQKSVLGEQIKACTAKTESLKTQAQRFEQQKESIVNKYCKLEEELQNAISTAALKQQQTADQIRQIQKDIQDHISESQLAQRNRELQEMLKTVDAMEDKVKALREQHMSGMRWLSTNIASFDWLIAGREKVMGIG